MLKVELLVNPQIATSASFLCLRKWISHLPGCLSQCYKICSSYLCLYGQPVSNILLTLLPKCFRKSLTSPHQHHYLSGQSSTSLLWIIVWVFLPISLLIYDLFSTKKQELFFKKSFLYFKLLTGFP